MSSGQRKSSRLAGIQKPQPAYSSSSDPHLTRRASEVPSISESSTSITRKIDSQILSLNSDFTSKEELEEYLIPLTKNDKYEVLSGLARRYSLVRTNQYEAIDYLYNLLK